MINPVKVFMINPVKVDSFIGFILNNHLKDPFKVFLSTIL